MLLAATTCLQMDESCASITSGRQDVSLPSRVKLTPRHGHASRRTFRQIFAEQDATKRGFDVVHLRGLQSR